MEYDVCGSQDVQERELTNAEVKINDIMHLLTELQDENFIIQNKIETILEELPSCGATEGEVTKQEPTILLSKLRDIQDKITRMLMEQRDVNSRIKL